MFTGLIESVGTFLSADLSGKAGKLRVESHKRFHDLIPGESIAVNGVCLTLEQSAGAVLEFHVMEESFRRTNLGFLQRGSSVNLERALALGSRLGGHIVSGHVDGTGKILSIGRVGDDTVVKVSLTPELRRYMVPKGSIAIDGISLTVAELWDDWFTVHIIPTTWRETNLSSRNNGDTVNLETDMLGKYVVTMLERMDLQQNKSNITMDILKNAGFGNH